MKQESLSLSGSEGIPADSRIREISSSLYQEGAFGSSQATPLILTNQPRRNRGFIEHLGVYYTLQLFLLYRIFCPNSIANSIPQRLTSFK